MCRHTSLSLLLASLLDVAGGGGGTGVFQIPRPPSLPLGGGQEGRRLAEHRISGQEALVGPSLTRDGLYTPRAIPGPSVGLSLPPHPVTGLTKVPVGRPGRRVVRIPIEPLTPEHFALPQAWTLDIPR